MLLGEMMERLRHIDPNREVTIGFAEPDGTWRIMPVVDLRIEKVLDVKTLEVVARAPHRQFPARP